MRKVGFHFRADLITVLFVCFYIQNKSREARFDDETRGKGIKYVRYKCTRARRYIKSLRIGGDVIIKELLGVPP